MSPAASLHPPMLIARVMRMQVRSTEIMGSQNFTDSQLGPLRDVIAPLRREITTSWYAHNHVSAYTEPFTELETAAASLERSLWAGMPLLTNTKPNRADLLARMCLLFDSDSTATPTVISRMIFDNLEQALGILPGMEAHFVRFPARLAFFSIALALSKANGNPLSAEDQFSCYLFLLHIVLAHEEPQATQIRSATTVSEIRHGLDAYQQVAPLYRLLAEVSTDMIAFCRIRGMGQNDDIFRNIFAQSLIYYMHEQTHADTVRHITSDMRIDGIEASEQIRQVFRQMVSAASNLRSTREGIFGLVTSQDEVMAHRQHFDWL